MGRMTVSALGMWVEGRYRFTPRIFAAARVDHLGFSRISGSIWTSPTTWDAPVDRIEWGGGYYLQRNLVARAVVQHNRRDGGRVRSRTFFSGQLAYWF
jgi:predicted porin